MKKSTINQNQLTFDFFSEIDHRTVGLPMPSELPQGVMATSLYGVNKVDIVLGGRVYSPQTDQHFHFCAKPEKRKLYHPKDVLLTSLLRNKKQRDERYFESLKNGIKENELECNFKNRLERERFAPYRINDMASISCYAVDLALETEETEEDCFELQTGLIMSVMSVILFSDNYEMTEGSIVKILSDDSKTFHVLKEAFILSNTMSNLKTNISWDWNQLKTMYEMIIKGELSTDTLYSISHDVARAIEKRWVTYSNSSKIIDGLLLVA